MASRVHTLLLAVQMKLTVAPTVTLCVLGSSINTSIGLEGKAEGKRGKMMHQDKEMQHEHFLSNLTCNNNLGLARVGAALVLAGADVNASIAGVRAGEMQFLSCGVRRKGFPSLKTRRNMHTSLKSRGDPCVV